MVEESFPPPVPPSADADAGFALAAGAEGFAARLSGPRVVPEPAGVDWHRYLASLRRYKLLVAGMTVAGLGVGVVLSRAARPEYRVQATIWIEVPPDRTDNRDVSGPIRQSQLLSSMGWVALLRSYVVLDYAVRELKLYLNYPPANGALFESFGLGEKFRPGTYRLTVDKASPVVTLATREGALVERVARGDSIGRSVGFVWAPPRALLDPGERVDFSLTTPRDAARELATGLSVITDQNGVFLRVELGGTNPVRIAKTINAVTERYVQVADQLKREKLTELSRILGEQLRQSLSNLRGTESVLQRFRVETVTLPSERATAVVPGLNTRDPVFDNFFNMKVELEQIRRDRDAIERALVQQADSGLSTDALEGIGAVQRSSELVAALKELTDKRAELRVLRYRYTDEHPPVQTLTAAIGMLQTRSIPAIAHALTADLTARELELNRRVQSASQELQQIPARAIEQARLERDVAIAGNLYTILEQRYEETRLAEVSSIPDVRILDAAVVPERPVRNRALQFLLMGVLAGLGMGVAGAVLLDRLDRRVRYPEQVTTGMGLPILGVVPQLSATNGSRDGTLPVLEALRGVRLNLVHAYGAAGPLLVTITSPGPGDGKSFVASNLALSFADAGHRTLLIDGDSRRGALHRVFRANRKPGLSDLLAGRVTQKQAVSATEHQLLQFIGCGSRLHNTPELLGSTGMVQLLTALRATFSVIIVDSPPLGAGVDAFALATATANLVLVLRTGTTDRELAGAKLEVLDRLPVRVLGAVMNGVKEWNVYRYYSYYMPGYSVEDEPGGGEKKLLGGVS